MTLNHLLHLAVLCKWIKIAELAQVFGLLPMDLGFLDVQLQAPTAENPADLAARHAEQERWGRRAPSAAEKSLALV
eukprot:CAMPEP_0115834540 /NCGR_PEP_ID=MMETSP0287-20121206/3735_1 /TAXON_ID=412157 /ORGANISM="Chrysochromulina rotalis, Strain UIO044" /LENGTH=75 /DNA_ID=CAMNT_0003287977 /DNA_START=348 /DNA_END=571 /DNA_ORIENTATION=-